MEKIINNKHVEYYKFGTGSKTMIMLPGLSQKSTIALGSFVEKAYSLFANDFTVYLVERASDLNDEDYIDEIANDYIGLFDELGLKDLYLLGCSFGGMICQCIALSRPELVKKMVLISTNSGGREESKDNIRRWYKLTSEKNVIDFTDDVINHIYSASIPEDVRKGMIESSKSLTDEEIKNFMIQARALFNYVGIDKIKNIKCPTFIIAAKGDKLFSYTESIFMNEQIPGSKLYLYGEECSHAIYDEVPEIKKQVYDFYME